VLLPVPTLKYWDGATWLPLIGNPAPSTYRPLTYSAKDDAAINVNATGYGAFGGPQVDAWVGANGVATLYYYAQVGVAGGSDLIVTYDAAPVSGQGGAYVAPSDANCLYVAPSNPSDTWSQGPGHVSGVMLATGLVPGQWRFNIHYRVSQYTTSVLRRRLVVIPSQLTVP
jgi:hypothetical protein